VATTLQDLFAELSPAGSRPLPAATGGPAREHGGGGDLVRRYFGADEAPFAWLTLNHQGVTGLPEIEARSRRELPSELNRLKLAGLRFELTHVGPMQWVPERNNLALGLIRFDVREGGTHDRLGYGTGKGEYHCATGSFEMLSLMVHAELPPGAGAADVAD
jgi:hypothetical protein